MAAPARHQPAAAILLGEMASPPIPDERDGLVQAAAIEQALKDRGIACSRITLGLDLAAAAVTLRALAPAFAVNLVEQIGGSGRLVPLAPALLDSLGIPYGGAGAEALSMTTNKPLAKRLLRLSGIDTPDWRMADESAESADVAAGDGPWIVKSMFEEASIGLDATALVPASSQLAAAFAARAARPGGPWFAERYIEGREFNVSLLDGGEGGAARPRVLPVAEIRFVDFPAGLPRIVDYAAKWDESSFAYHHTCRAFPDSAADAALLEKLAAQAVAAWNLFGLRGYARADFRVDEAGRPWMLEVNANPCLSPDAGFMAAALRAGLDFAGVVAAILPVAAALPGGT